MPYRPLPKHTSSYSAIHATVCVGCRANGVRTELTPAEKKRGDWWCEACKDTNGVLTRARKAQEEARQRCQETYPCRDMPQLGLFDGEA